MTQKEIIAKLHKNNKFIFIGTERYLVDFSIAELKKVLNSDFAAFNFIELEHKAENFSDVQTKIASTPMMDEKKIVHIKNFNFAEDNGVWSKNEFEEFINLVENLSDDTILILSNNLSKSVTTSKNYKKLNNKFEVLHFQKLKNQELIEFISELIAEELEKGSIRKEIISDIAKKSGYLHDDSKQSLYDIDNLIKKVISFYLEKGGLTKSDVIEIFDPKEESNIFALINAIKSKDKFKAFKEYNTLVENGEPKVKILTTIGRIFSNAIKVDFLISAGHTKDVICEELGKSIYAINNSERLASKLGRKKMIRMLEELIEIDYKMKTGLLAEDFYAEVLLIKLFDIIDEE